MADNIKISELVELTSGSLSDATIVPVLDGGTTKKASLSSLQSYLTDDLATDSELATQIGNVNTSIGNINSTISGLDTDDITEGSNEYFTNAKVNDIIRTLGLVSSSAQVDVKSQLNTENVISSSQQISASAAASGFGVGGGGASIPNGTVSSSAQTIINLGGSTILSGSLSSTDISDFGDAVSSSAASAGFGAGGEGGGGSSDYVSNVTFAGSTLTFTGVGGAFGSTVDLSGESLAAQTDLDGKLAVSTYIVDSASFATRVGGGGGGSVPAGTVSSSAQTIENINTIGVFSSSNQVQVNAANLTGFDTDDIDEGTVNKFANSENVIAIINTIGVTSGSAVMMILCLNYQY